MIKILYILTVFLSLSVSAQLNVNYSMDECSWDGTTGDVKDSSANGYDATSHSSDTITAKLCKGGDFSASGKDDYLSLPKAVLDGLDAFTFMTWVNTTKSKQEQEIIHAVGSDVNDDEFQVYINKSKKLAVSVMDTKKTCKLGTSITDGTWHHIAVVRQGNTVKCYLDGNEKDTKNGYGTGALSVHSNGVVVGQEQDSIGGGFNLNQALVGKLDELKIYSDALTDSQIQNIFSNENSGKNYDGTARVCSCIEAIADYRMDECSWSGATGEVIDSSGNNNDATTHGEIPSSVGKLCQSGDYNNVDKTHYIRTDNKIARGGSEEITVMGWIYVYGDIGDWINLWHLNPDDGNNQSSNSRQPALWLNKSDNSKLHVRNDGVSTGNLGIYESFGAITFNAWHHITQVVTKRQIKLYIDGTSKDTYDSNQDFKFNDGYFYIGDKWYRKNMKIDEVKIFTKALAQKQIGDIYNNEKDAKNYDATPRECLCLKPVFDYRMDACSWSGSTGEVLDAMGEHNATAKNGAITEDNASVGGGICKVGKFDGVDDYIELPSMGGENFKDGLSIFAWANFGRDSDGQYERIIDLGGGSDGKSSNIIMSRSDKSNDLLFTVGGCTPFITAAGGIIPNEMHHYAATLDIDKNVTLYRDGVKIGGGTITCLPADIERGHNYIARSNYKDAGDPDFQGRIDEVKIFPKAVDAAKVQEIYNNEKSGKNYDGSQRDCLRCQLTPMADYRMDACSWANDVVKDSSGNGHDGIVRNGADTNESGRICRKGMFNGVNQYVSVTIDVPEVNYSSMFWFKSDASDANRRQRGLFAVVNKDTGIGGQDRLLYLIDGKICVRTWQNEKICTSGKNYADGSWHHVVHVLDGRHQILYVDGEEEARGNKGKSDFYWQERINIGFAKDAQQGYFKGTMDEVKIFDTALTLPEIRSIYNNENAGNNYDGTKRSCPSCGTSLENFNFDVWDTFRNMNDRNTSTKISGQDFNLLLASLTETNDAYQEFNGTVCTQIVDAKHANTPKTPWVKSIFSDENTSVALYRVYSALEEARVSIKWQKDSDVTCGAMLEDNSTLSSDAFSVRPNGFTCKIDTGVLVAELDYPFRISATQFGSTIATPDYNTSNVLITPNRYMNNSERNDSLVGNFSTTNILPFEDGNTSSSGTLSFSDVAIIGIDINDSTWANIDSDDTPLSDRIIHSECNRTFGADHFDLLLAMPEMENNTTSFTYLSNDLNMSASVKNLNVQLSARGKNGGILKNYKIPQSHFFAKNIDITPSLTLPDAPHGSAISIDNPPIESNVVKDFDEGSVDINYTNVRFNYPRIYKEPQNPFLINGADANYSVNVVENANSDVNGSNATLVNANATFYFGRLHPKDVKTSEDPAITNIEIEVYDKNGGNFVDTFRRNSLHWYRNEDHDSNGEGNASSISAMSTMTLSATSVFDIAQSDISSPSNGLINVTIPKQTGRYFLHIKTQPWLWYAPDGFGNAYDDSVNSQCTDHPCFEYISKMTSTPYGVRSGEFTGSDYNVSDRGDYVKKGVKVFR